MPPKKKSCGKKTCGKNKKKQKKPYKPRVRKDPKVYEPTIDSDRRYTLAEKLLLGEELAQYSFSTGSFLIAS